MVLVDRRVGLVDEFQEIIKETQGLSLNQRIASVLSGLPACSTGERGALQHKAIEKEITRYRAEVEERALEILRQRKASRTSALRKEPLPGVDASVYGELLDGIDLCVSPVADAPSVTRLSLKISWPPGHPLKGNSSGAFIASCHHCFLVLYVGGYRPGHLQPGFYLVYNAWANSVAIIPPLFCIDKSHCDIGAGVAVLCCGKEGEYVLAELLLHRGVRSLLPTNRATLFLWEPPGRWVKREVVLPLPAAAAAAAAAQATTMPTCSFRADMVFAVSFSSLCWVDLLTGILVYSHIGTREFHFIPLPVECAGMPREGRPEEYRSMCCIDRQTLKFVSMDGYKQGRPIGDLTLTTWTLRRPLSPRNWKWEKDAVSSSFRIRDLWDDPVYREKLNLQPLMPSCPVISTREPGIIYLSFTDYKYNHSNQQVEARGVYVLSLNMDRCRVESAYKVPSDENEITPHPRIFTSDFSSYLNKVREWELIRCKRDGLSEGSRGKELADEGESRSNPSTPYTVGVGLGMLKLSSGGLGARLIIPTPCTALGPSSRKTGPVASSFCPVGLQAALDIAIG